MPRLPRKKSESGIYHIMLRGINQQVIFEDDEDYIQFIKTLEKYKTVCGYKIFAYCLMSNHVHILIKVGKEDLELILKRIAGSYVYWYNWKYYRKGHLFQDRFKSECVEDDAYFLTVLRYIHQNPLKAKIVNKVSDYKYSSYNEYIHPNNTLIDNDFVLEMMSIGEFVEFNNIINNDECLDMEEQIFRISDSDAISIIKKISGCDTPDDFNALTISEKNKYVCLLKKEGLSIRQISRLTGISFAIVRKI